MIRSVAAVLAGLLVTAVLVMVLGLLAAAALGIPATSAPATAYLGLNLAGGALAGVSGGAVAVRLAPHTPHGHVGALAALILLLSLPTLLSPPPPAQPGWYGPVLSILGPVSVVLGGYLSARSRNRQQPGG